MNNNVKRVLYLCIILSYGLVMTAFLFNYFIILIIVPFMAIGWALTVFITFLKDLHRFSEDIREDSLKNWGEVTSVVVEWEEEPKDIEWKFETTAMILFPLYIIVYIVIGVAL